ncbi:SpoIIE family protein phosphatase [Spirochaeta cellobiosiphila]|uniref:SpoIIE family protein phosphatase n=1 Tax=Spirochaeta cellobiosiphila TaxID=504483 RepID=UPI0003FA7E3D|nr:SpoIIE family protein phosphatase [Spirochaeta cellobiosiphila]
MIHRSIKGIIFIFLLITGSLIYGQEYYWENPESFAGNRSRFPMVDSYNGTFALLWQDFSNANSNNGDLNLSIAIKKKGQSWKKFNNIINNIPYFGEESPIASLTLNDNGIYIAYIKSDSIIAILHSDYDNIEFKEISLISTGTDALSPKIFTSQKGMYLLFSQGFETSISIFYTYTSSGSSWTSPQALIKDDENLNLNFSPYGTQHNGKDYIVFQSQHSGERANYQLYMKTSEDGGQSWSNSQWITNFSDGKSKNDDSSNYNNQRPNIYSYGGILYISWERNLLSNPNQIYIGIIANQTIENWESVTRSLYTSGGPQLFEFKQKLNILWFDNQKGDFHIKLGTKEEYTWKISDLSIISGTSTFPKIVHDENDIFVFWENTQGNIIRIYQLEPDRSVSAPVPRAVNFKNTERSRLSTYQIQWSVPPDSSGIEGYNFLWNQNPDDSVPPVLTYLNNQNQGKFIADEDGEWYFHIRAKDYAGNWSEEKVLSVYRDTTSPPMVKFSKLDYDNEGFLINNSPKINWTINEPYLQGYSYKLNYLGEPSTIINPSFSGTDPGTIINNKKGSITFNNMDNGLYALKVKAFDSVGNSGPIASTLFRVNKYQPVTYISWIDSNQDDFGRISIHIIGRGFLEGGAVSSIYLDRDGIAPFDYTYNISDGSYQISSDKQIRDLVISDIPEGKYRIGLVHPRRGTYFAKSYLYIQPSGTVKFGDFSWEEPGFISLPQHRFVLNANYLVSIVILCLLAIVTLFSFGQIFVYPIKENRLAGDMLILVQKGHLSAEEKRTRINELKRKGFGLRFKFAFSILILLTTVLLMISLALGFFMIGNQQENLASALKQQAEVLMTGFSKSASNYLPSESELELSLIPQQMSAMSDAQFSVITGPGRENRSEYNHVWGVSNFDSSYLKDNINTDNYVQGISTYEDEITNQINDLALRINQEGKASLQDISSEIDRLTQEASLHTGTDQNSTRIRSDLFDQIYELDSLRNNILDNLSKYTGTYPNFDTEHLDLSIPSYLFYKPITYARRGEDTYYRGTVRVVVSTERIREEIRASRNELIKRTGIIALIAITLGIVGSIILSSITVNPIKKLVKGIEIIRDTEDKSELKNHKIDITSKDELELLAQTINQMTKGLVKAAEANKELTVGKEVQKMFIPLDSDDSGRKMTTGGESTKYADFFGYYEGAKGVSGDYFDYRKLDNEHYALIKCDVAGKGVPASLIMVEVATIFLNHFREYNTKQKVNLPPLVYRINDLLEERGFKGRFAAFNLGILNIRTGEAYFCHAGDKTIHGWDAQKGISYQKHMTETPAAGVFPSMLVEMQSGFKQQKIILNRGDMLFFFTDGLEEAQRHLRNSKYEIEVCSNPDHQREGTLITHLAGKDTEEFSLERLHQVIDSVMNRQKYQLFKYHNPLGEDSPLDFDFSSCNGTIQEVVLAMVSLEKVFRLYPDPKASINDKIRIDVKVDDFLREHFVQYEEYFGYPLDYTDLQEYRYYSYIKEDEQYDDLTILGIQRK